MSIRFGRYLPLSMNVCQVLGFSNNQLCVLKFASLWSNVFRFSLLYSFVRLSTMNDFIFCWKKPIFAVDNLASNKFNLI